MKNASPDSSNPANTCQYCNKTLHGRSDQRFCNDTCRNTSNRIKRKEDKIADHENTPAIFQAISRNYEILKSCKPVNQPDSFIWIEDCSKIIQQGFNPKFFTSIFNDQKQTWHCIFEYGFAIDKNSIIIGWFPRQAEI